jgi:hypothetical protein
MSVAYFIVLEDENIDIDTFVNGKNIALAFDELVSVCNKHGIKTIEDYISQDASEFLGELDDINVPDQGVLWFDAQEGLDWARRLIDTLKTEKLSCEVGPVIEELNEYIGVFNKAKKHGIKWHLELDF